MADKRTTPEVPEGAQQAAPQDATSGPRRKKRAAPTIDLTATEMPSPEAASPPQPDPPAKLLDYDGVPTDHYLWLTGQAGQMLRGKLPVSAEIYLQTNHTTKTTSPL